MFERHGSLNLVYRRDGNLGSLLLYVFVTCLAHILIVTDDIELHDMNKPLPPHQIRRCILLLKKLLYRATCIDDIKTANDKAIPPASNETTDSNKNDQTHLDTKSATYKDKNPKNKDATDAEEQEQKRTTIAQSTRAIHETL